MNGHWSMAPARCASTKNRRRGHRRGCSESRRSVTGRSRDWASFPFGVLKSVDKSFTPEVDFHNQFTIAETERTLVVIPVRQDRTDPVASDDEVQDEEDETDTCGNGERAHWSEEEGDHEIEHVERHDRLGVDDVGDTEVPIAPSLTVVKALARSEFAGSAQLTPDNSLSVGEQGEGQAASNRGYAESGEEGRTRGNVWTGRVSPAIRRSPDLRSKARKRPRKSDGVRVLPVVGAAVLSGEGASSSPMSCFVTLKSPFGRIAACTHSSSSRTGCVWSAAGLTPKAG